MAAVLHYWSLLCCHASPARSVSLSIHRLSPSLALSQVVRLAQEVALLQGQLAEVVGVKRAQLDAELAKLQASGCVLYMHACKN